MSKVSVAVMCVPDRVQYVTDHYTAKLPPFSLVVDESQEGNKLTARRAWSTVTQGASHHLVLQDDLVLCRNLIPALEAVIEYLPTDLISLFNPYGKQTDEARARGEAWFISDGIWGQANLMPVSMVKDWLDWDAANVVGSTEDRSMTLYMLTYGLMAWMTCPSLVEHDGAERSTMGHRPPNVNRRAAWFIGEDGDALAVNWTAGTLKPLSRKAYTIKQFAKNLRNYSGD